MDLFEAIERRRSIRKFKEASIPESDLKRILDAGRLAPSGGNRQPWYFVVVTDREKKKALSIAANNQRFIEKAGVIVVALGDPKATPARMPYATASTRVPHLQDPMIAVEHMVLAATALGYGTCWIGAFNEEDVKRILNIPEDLAVIALLPIGIPEEHPQQKPRKALNEICFKESYGIPLQL